MKTTPFLYAAIFALTLAAACSDDTTADTTGPEITLLQPQNEDAFTRGQNVPIAFDLADPSGINGYKIDIHYAGDGHTHSHSLAVALSEEEPEEAPWNYQEVYDDHKGKTSAHVEISLTVLANAQEGEYHLGILATDAVGNESQVYIDIDIEEE